GMFVKSRFGKGTTQVSVIRRPQAVRLISLAVVLAGGGIAAAIVVPAVRAHGLVAPVNAELPSVVVQPGVGSRVTILSGSWSGSPTSFSYQYLRCPRGGGAPDGSGCVALGAPTPAPDPHLINHADEGHTIRVRVIATNAGGSTAIVSAPSETAFDL